ncbi:hypothetical protein CJU90_2078 [Yarrowia sp. C11]|nr:hypothetical protein CJU90_2078 [Yarrowia sp. C11]
MDEIRPITATIATQTEPMATQTDPVPEQQPLVASSEEPKKKKRYDKMQIACFILIGLFVLGAVLVVCGLFLVPYIIGIPMMAVGAVFMLFCIGFWIGVACSHRKKKPKKTRVVETV